VNVRPPQKAIQLVWRNGEGIKFMGDKLAQLKNYNRAFCIIGDCVMSGVFGFLGEERFRHSGTISWSDLEEMCWWTKHRKGILSECRTRTRQAGPAPK
jgi:hypothetical protein